VLDRIQTLDYLSQRYRAVPLVGLTYFIIPLARSLPGILSHYPP
jgi:hypothetical protein